MAPCGKSFKALSEYLGHSDPRTHQYPSETDVPWPPDAPSGDRKKARPEDPARYQQPLTSRPHKAIRLMPRLMQPMAEVLPFMQQLVHVERIPRPAPVRHRRPDESRRAHRFLADAP